MPAVSFDAAVFNLCESTQLDPESQLWLDKTREWLEEGVVDPNIQDEKGQTVLHNLEERFKGRPGAFLTAVVRLFVQHGADVNAQDLVGKTPLHTTRSPLIMELLVEHGADFTIPDANGRTPAPLEGITNAKDLQIFLGPRVSPVLLSITQRSGETLLHMAVGLTICYKDEMAEARDLCEKILSQGADVFAKNNLGYTALTLAVEKATAEDFSRGWIRYLFSPCCERADVLLKWAAKAPIGRTKLHYLLEEVSRIAPDMRFSSDMRRNTAEFIKNVKYLMNNHTNVNDLCRQDRNGDTPVHLLLRQGWGERTRAQEIPKYVCRLISENFPGVWTTVNRLGNTPLHEVIASSTEDKKSTHFLLKLVVFQSPSLAFEICNAQNQTPLEFAVARGKVFAVRILLHQRDPKMIVPLVKHAIESTTPH